MNWNGLKQHIYFEDGSLRDIYVFDTKALDWQKWIDFVNTNYKLDFYDGKSNKTYDKIDFKIVEDFWTGNREVITAKIQLDNFTINCHFFYELEIENDINPREFQTIRDHENLLQYLNEISRILNRKVCLTDENTPESILISVENKS